MPKKGHLFLTVTLKISVWLTYIKNRFQRFFLHTNTLTPPAHRGTGNLTKRVLRLSWIFPKTVKEYEAKKM